MKIDRLIGIITTLQQKGKVTIPYLAAKYEVSKRTISRDIEEISKAGIPIVTTQGVGGGVSLMEGYVLDTTVFTRQELSDLMIGLGAVGSVEAGGNQGTQQLSDKLGSGQDRLFLDRDVIIDLSSFYKNRLSHQIRFFRNAIAQRRMVQFHYFYPKGEEDKQVEPYRVVFQWSDWYLLGFNPKRKDFRLYKLNRMGDYQLLDESYTPRELTPETVDFNRYFKDDYYIEAVFDSSQKYRLVEEYGTESFTQQEDGSLYTRWGFTNMEYALYWFLGFGSKVKILDPQEFQERYVQELERMRKQY